MTVTVEPSADRARPSGGISSAPPEILTARIALGVIAIAVLDDAFVHREPGTSVADHVAGGLIPVAIAVIAAFAYPRLRPGLRAVVALVLDRSRSSPASSTDSGMSRSTGSPATT